MALEIEKKYRLEQDMVKRLELRLQEIGADFIGKRFETNTLFSNEMLALTGAYVRIRTVDGKGELTFKRRIGIENGIKKQIEFETGVEDAETAQDIIEHLGFSKQLVYEKRRSIWQFGETEVVLDELPFGLYMEIEGTEDSIGKAEKVIGVTGIMVETMSYPALTMANGTEKSGVVCAVFAD